MVRLAAQIDGAKKLDVNEIILITTHAVKLSKPLRTDARKMGIQITHYWSEYAMLPNGKMKLKYKRVNY